MGNKILITVSLDQPMDLSLMGSMGRADHSALSAHLRLASISTVEFHRNYMMHGGARFGKAPSVWLDDLHEENITGIRRELHEVNHKIAGIKIRR